MERAATSGLAGLPTAAAVRRRLPSRDAAVGLAFTLVIILLVLLALLLIDLLSAARAYIGGESQWSKSQKSAVQHLLAYAETRESSDWQRYEQAIAVPLADRRAREEMDRPDPDPAVVHEGFVAGGVHPDDVPRMMRLYRGFGELPFMAKVIRTWVEGDRRIHELTQVAGGLHGQVLALEGPQAVRGTLMRLRELDDELTTLEDRFSRDLAEAARTAQTVATAGLLLLAVGLGGLALAFARRQSRRTGRTLRALRESETRLRTLWETTQDSVLIIDADSTILFCNPAVEASFGWRADELRGQPLAVLQPEALRGGHAAGMARYLRSGQRRLDWRSVEIPVRHRHGHDVPVEVSFAEMQLQGQTCFVGFLRDIGRRKQAEEALRSANEALEQRVAQRTQELTQANDRLRELDRLKSEFLATMSHELRTPLNAILGFSSLLRAGASGPVTADQQRQLGLVQGAGEHLLALINDLLDVSRIASGRMVLDAADFELAAVLAEVRETLLPAAQAKGLRLIDDTPHTLRPLLCGDRRKVYQVLLNLVNNALKFTPAGEVRIVAEVEGDEVCIRVIDTGIGISPAQQALLFQPFRQLDGGSTRSHEGTGLGLYYSRRLVALMNGSITVCSAPGQGSTFTVRLPLRATAAVAAPAEAG